MYTGDSRVAAVLLGGSSARGHADRYSDLELFVVWTEPPTEADRAAAISAAGGDLVTLYPVDSGAWSDAWKVGRRDGAPFTGVEVDMSHYLAETVEQILGDVVDNCDPDPLKQLGVGGILHAIPLHGAELVKSWQERAARYPDGLRLAVVRAHAQIEGLWRLDAYAARGNPVADGAGRGDARSRRTASPRDRRRAAAGDPPVRPSPLRRLGAAALEREDAGVVTDIVVAELDEPAGDR